MLENPGKTGLISRIFDIFSHCWACFVLVSSSDPLRSGQGCRHSLQHHRSRRWSTSEWHLQHRPHQRQHVCHPTPGQRGESVLPRKKEMNVSVLSPSCFPSMYIYLIISQLSQWKCALPFAFPISLSFLPLMSPAKNKTTSQSTFRGLTVLCLHSSLSRFWLMPKPVMKWRKCRDKTRNHFSCYLIWSLATQSGAGWIEQREETERRWRAGKLLSFTVRANEQVQLAVCACACLCICKSVFMPAHTVCWLTYDVHLFHEHNIRLCYATMFF